MNKKIITVLIILVISLVLIITKNNKFYLDDNYYNNQNELQEISIEEVKELILNKKSFAVFIHEPRCLTSQALSGMIKNYLNKNNMSMYTIPFSKFKESGIENKIKYYPSVVLFDKGKVISFLEADNDDHLKYYDSEEGFKEWFETYILLK